MRQYAIRRALFILPTLLIISSMLFIMFRVLPGDIVDNIVAQQAWTQESGTSSQPDPDAIRQALGLADPLWMQYVKWIGGLFKGDFGVSIVTGQTLWEECKTRIPVTLELNIISLILSLSVSIPLGIYSAIRQDTPLDYIGRTVAILLLAIPSFWVATLIMVYPALWWGWSPPIEYIRLSKDPIGNLVQFLIPSVILGLFTSGGLMRITRTMMLEVLRQDYIRTAWAKGLRERAVIIRHAAKNTLIPVITIAAGMIPGLLGGSVIIEQIFSLPGMGRYLLKATLDRDLLIVAGWNLIMAIFVMVIILLTDLSYAVVDPRVRYK
jgi:peptide/nickel transport system permease protein